MVFIERIETPYNCTFLVIQYEDAMLVMYFRLCFMMHRREKRLKSMI